MEKNTLIYGIRAVIEAVDSNESINRVFMQRGLNNKNGFELIKKLKIKLKTYSNSTTCVVLQFIHKHIQIHFCKRFID